jgi:hypothetical protein
MDPYLAIAIAAEVSALLDGGAGVALPPEPGLVPNPNHRPSEEGTYVCTCESYPHKSWCGPWKRASGVLTDGGKSNG